MKKLSPSQWAILALAVATGLIHLLLLNLRMNRLDIPFTLNGIGYLTLAAVYVFKPKLPLPVLNDRNLLRWVFIGFTAVTILAWFIISRDFGDVLAIITKLIEVALIAALWMDKE